MNNKLRVTAKEEKILRILWESNSPLIASQIAKSGEQSLNTVQAVLRTLLKNELIEVADIIHSGTVLCRSYKPTRKATQFIIEDFSDNCKFLSKKVPPSTLFADLFEIGDDEVISALEALIAEKHQSHPME